METSKKKIYYLQQDIQAKVQTVFPILTIKTGSMEVNGLYFDKIVLDLVETFYFPN